MDKFSEYVTKFLKSFIEAEIDDSLKERLYIDHLVEAPPMLPLVCFNVKTPIQFKDSVPRNLCFETKEFSIKLFFTMQPDVIADVSIKCKPSKNQGIAQLMVMINCLFNEAVFNEMLTFLYCASLFADVAFSECAKSMNETSFDLTLLNCFAFNESHLF